MQIQIHEEVPRNEVQACLEYMAFNWNDWAIFGGAETVAVYRANGSTMIRIKHPDGEHVTLKLVMAPYSGNKPVFYGVNP